MKNVIEAITGATKLADRVESLSYKVTEIAKTHREDAKSCDESSTRWTSAS